jgi:hypothetical protein
VNESGRAFARSSGRLRDSDDWEGSAIQHAAREVYPRGVDALRVVVYARSRQMRLDGKVDGSSVFSTL